MVWAPKMFSVIPEPNAAPNPSLRGRCIRTTKTSRTQTITRMVSKIGIKIDSHIRAGNMGWSGAIVKEEVRRGERAGRAKNSTRPAYGFMLGLSAPVLSRDLGRTISVE